MADDLEHKKGLLRTNEKNLQDLEKRAAMYGPLEVPLWLLRQIDVLKDERRELKTEIAMLEQPSLSPKPLVETTSGKPSGDELGPGRERKPAVSADLQRLNQILVGEVAAFQIDMQTVLDRDRLFLLHEECNRLKISPDAAILLVRSCAFYGVDAGCWFRRKRGGRFDFSDEDRSQLARTLITLLKQEDSYELRLAVIDALGEIRCDEASDVLLRLVDDSDRQIRHAVIKALGRIGSPDVIPKLMEIGIRRKDSRERVKKTWRNKRGRERGWWQNEGREKTPDWATREWVVWALGEMASNESTRPALRKHASSELLEILKNPRNAKRLRQRAAWALGEMRDKRSIKYLLDVAKHEPDPLLQKIAERAVERISEGP